MLPLPAPTTARPGSAAKIEILRKRAEAGEQLFHPDDEGIPVYQPSFPVRYHRPPRSEIRWFPRPLAEAFAS